MRTTAQPYTAVVDRSSLHAIQTFAARMVQHRLPWALIGSANLALQGMDMQPKDIDVVVRPDDLARVREIFTAEGPTDITEVRHTAGEPTREFGLILGGVLVQVLTESERGVYVTKLLAGRVTRARLGETEIPCLALDAEADAYDATARSEKAQRIREFLAAQQA